MTTTKLMTAEELLAMPDDGRMYELVEGVLVEESPAGVDASSLVARILARLLVFVEERDLGLIVGADGGFFFGRDPDTVRAPDVAFIRAERVPPPGDRSGYSPVIPDLAIEVVSPGDRQSKIDKKVDSTLRPACPSSGCGIRGGGG